MRSGKVRFGDCHKTERLTQRLVDDKFQTMKSCMGTIMFRDGRLSVTLFVPYLLLCVAGCQLLAVIHIPY